MKNQAHLETGKAGEKEGVSYLKQAGYRILETNYRSPIGEIDVVGKHEGFIVFIEIKTRRQHHFGAPEESVTKQKQRKIALVASCYLKEKRLLNRPVRFDVLSVYLGDEAASQCHLIQNAFEVDAD